MSDKRGRNEGMCRTDTATAWELERRLTGDVALLCDSLRSTATVYGVILPELFRRRREYS
jgi:hypothetical protein